MNVKPMAVFRIENANREGPYSVGTELDYSWDLHPHLEDEGFDYTECEYFGFPSVTALETWFYGDLLRQLLERGGFGIAIYSVPSDQCIVSPTQLAFCEDEAEKRGWLSLEDAYDSTGEQKVGALADFVERLTAGLEIVHFAHELVAGRKAIHDLYDAFV